MLLGETFRMVNLKCISCNGKLVKIAKTRFIGFQLLISPTKSTFLGKNLVSLDTHAKKMHGKAYWLIA